jgi:hypothetical protein
MLGFLGDSDRPGFRRLYFTRDLDYYAEFRADDVVDIEAIPAEQPPFPGDEATRLTLRRDATVEYTRVRTGRPLDEFDLDVRLGRRLPAVQGDRLPLSEPFACLEPATPPECPNTPETCGGITCIGTCLWMWTCGGTCLGTCFGDPCPEQRRR